MLSIIIPTLNEEYFLPKLLKSIKKQNFSNYEIIVSDGYSEDNTEKIAKNFNCKIIKNHKRHPAVQRNEGAKQALGDVLLFLDADVFLPQNCLENAYNNFKLKNLSAAGFYLKTKEKKFFYKCVLKILNFLFFVGQKIKPAFIGVGMMVKKETHFLVNGFDEEVFVGEDYDYIHKIHKKGKVGMIKYTFIYYSFRRFKKEGNFKVLGKWLKGTFHFLFIGPIKNKIFDYDFGNYNFKKKKK